MTQREVTDNDGTRWTCVQAFAGLEGKAAEKATELSDNEEGKVQVVCTPSGGAQTVRLTLTDKWIKAVSDEKLVSAIQAAIN